MPENYTPQPWTPQPWQPDPSVLPPVGGGGNFQLNPPAFMPYGPSNTMPGEEGEQATGYLPPPTAGDIGYRPGFAPGASITGGPRQLVGSLYGGRGSFLGNAGQAIAGAAGSAAMGPLGGLISRLLYNRTADPFTATVFPEGYTYENYQRDQNMPSNFLSRRREGSGRFSQGEMNLSSLPMERSAHQYMPAVFAGQRGSVLPGGGGQAPVVEQR